MMRTLFDERLTVLLSGHYGDFEMSSYVLGVLGFHVYAIARPLDNVYLDRFVEPLPRSQWATHGAEGRQRTGD